MDYNYKKVSRVRPKIFITNWESSIDPDALIANDIKAIITVANKYRPEEIVRFQNKHNIKTMHIFLDDVPYAPIRKYFDETAAFIQRCVDMNENVLVHCMAGISRSATLIIHYLMKNDPLTYVNPQQSYNSIYKSILPIRPINPNPGFIAQLIDHFTSMTDAGTSPGSERLFKNNGDLTNYTHGITIILFYSHEHSKVKDIYDKFSSMVTPHITALSIDIDRNKILLSKVNPLIWGYSIEYLPIVVGYYNGRFYSEYMNMRNGVNCTKSPEDFVIYAEGVGVESVTYSNV